MTQSLSAVREGFAGITEGAIEHFVEPAINEGEDDTSNGVELAGQEPANSVAMNVEQIACGRESNESDGPEQQEQLAEDAAEYPEQAQRFLLVSQEALAGRGADDVFALLWTDVGKNNCSKGRDERDRAHGV